MLAALLLGLSSVCAAQDERAEALDVSGLLRQARASAAKGAPAASGAPVLEAAVVPTVGHNTQNQPAVYDIWALNCHSQANLFVAIATHRGIEAGVLACQGDPMESPAYHTANWALDGKGRTCVYNWGQQCCWDASVAPPDIVSGPGNACARAACGAQYHAAQTRAMPAGIMVESPGPQSCAIFAAGGPLNMQKGRAIAALTERGTTGAGTVRVPVHPDLPEGALLNFSQDRLDTCNACCETRAELWSGNKAASTTLRLAQAREKKFRTQCLSACRYAFSAAKSSADE